MKKILSFLAVFLFPFAAQALPISITGYDIDNSYLSGAGNWHHSYDGTIAPVGASLANYSGGSGTLNDGEISTSVDETHLFNYPDDSSPVITLYLDGFYTINEMTIFGGYFDNAIPGSLDSLDITIAGLTESFITSAQGSATYTDHDDFVSLGGSSLDGLATNQLVLSGFLASTYTNNIFSIAEISLDGDIAAVPEPSSLILLMLGLAGIAFVRRKNI